MSSGPVVVGDERQRDQSSAVVPLSAQQNCPLLSLPPELRNRIYRYLLLDDVEMSATNPHPRVPSILRTCRQLRREGLGIWLLEPDWSHDICDCDGKWVTEVSEPALGAIDEAAAELGAIDRPLEMKTPVSHFSGATSWENLLVWLQAMHAEQDDEMPHNGQGAWTDIQTITAAQAIVAGMSKEPWERAKEVLDRLHELVSAHDSRWE